jgi:hypothetical protein
MITNMYFKYMYKSIFSNEVLLFIYFITERKSGYSQNINNFHGLISAQCHFTGEICNVNNHCTLSERC